MARQASWWIVVKNVLASPSTAAGSRMVANGSALPPSQPALTREPAPRRLGDEARAQRPLDDGEDLGPVLARIGPRRIEPPRAKPKDASRDPLSPDFCGFLERLAAMPEVRHDLVKRVRAQIARGEYEDEQKIHRAAEALADEWPW